MTCEVIDTHTCGVDDRPMDITDRTTDVLDANARFSIASGSAVALLGTAPGRLLGPPGWVLVVVGAGIVAFGFVVRRAARANPVRALPAVLAADMGWIVAVTLLLSLAPSLFTIAGVTGAVAATAAVTWFAWKEWRLVTAR